MVHFEEVNDSTNPLTESLLEDALDIERVAASLVRPSAKARLENLVQTLKKEAAETAVPVASHAMDIDISSETFPIAVTPVSLPVNPPRMISSSTVSSSSTTIGTSLKYTTIESFSFDLGGYNSPTISIYVDLPNIGTVSRENITCDFTPTSFDLKILHHPRQDHNYRLLNDSLDKEIDPTLSKFVVKSNKIVIKLQKKKGEYGSYDYWSDLNSKKTKKKNEKENDKNKDPSASIMELMKDMYDSGDDNMRKIIGETMMKQREGKLGKDKPFGMDDDDFKM